ncbi:hypothetical protein [Priestia taiwanensis]|uniref:Uncharacterized protein n=1 Tax=Priestia taiwanensis TaxID=1347902 RepID=A0A917AMY5_9BACI|nr:hypothetical protein [Priestia taiwanensis]MBM7362486.1 hypothetical protein [Priestia taiwanensis]GGE62608.1 hypothetical protein GCM10007140_11090 [Priestia taiwanensis]
MLRVIGISPWSDGMNAETGWHYTVFIGLFFIIIAWVGMNKYGKRTYSFLRMFAYTFISGWIVVSVLNIGKNYYLSFYDDLRVVEYSGGDSHCSIRDADEYEKKQREMKKVECTLTFVNRSKKEMRFNVTLVGPGTETKNWTFKDKEIVISSLARETYHLEATVSKSELNYDSMQSQSPHIIIHRDGETKEFSARTYIRDRDM